MSISISVFGMGDDSDCQAFFVPSYELMEIVAGHPMRGPMRVAFGVFIRYSKPHKPKPGFHVVFIKSNMGFSGTFYCSTKSKYCGALMDALPGGDQSLQPCHEDWAEKEVELQMVRNGQVALVIAGDVKSIGKTLLLC